MDFNVPDGYCLLSDALEMFLKENNINHLIDNLQSANEQDVNKLLSEISEKILL